MTDEELQKTIEELLDGSTTVAALADDTFKAVVSGLSRMYAARIFNCVDATGKSDTEWAVLSSVLKRAEKAL